MFRVRRDVQSERRGPRRLFLRRRFRFTSDGLVSDISHLTIRSKPKRLVRNLSLAKNPETLGFFIFITHAIKRFDAVKAFIRFSEFFAQAFDVAVNRTVIDINLIIIGRIHQLIA